MTESSPVTRLREALAEQQRKMAAAAEARRPKPHALDRFRRKKRNLVCPFCGFGRRNPDPWGGDVSVKRDSKGTRTCRRCVRSWLPVDDPPDAGGPYKRRRSESS